MASLKATKPQGANPTTPAKVQQAKPSATKAAAKKVEQKLKDTAKVAAHKTTPAGK